MLPLRDQMHCGASGSCADDGEIKLRRPKSTPGTFVGRWRADRTKTLSPPLNHFPSTLTSQAPHHPAARYFQRFLGLRHTCAAVRQPGWRTTPATLSHPVKFCKSYQSSYSKTWHRLTPCHIFLPPVVALVFFPHLQTTSWIFSASYPNRPMGSHCPGDFWVPCPSRDATVSAVPVEGLKVEASAGSLAVLPFSVIHTPTPLSLLRAFQNKSSLQPRQCGFQVGAISCDKAVGSPWGFSRN